VEEYLASSYEPDCDYVDGHIEERNLGKTAHPRLQLRLGFLLDKRAASETEVLIAVRIRVSGSRIRVADVCVAANDSDEPIVTKPPLIYAEVLP